MASAQEYQAWLDKNPQKKGTSDYATVETALREATAEENLAAGQQEGAGQSVLYERPQVGVGRKFAQSAGKGITGALDLLIGAPENVKRIYQYATTPDMPVPRAAAPLQTYLTEKGVFTPEAEFSGPAGRVADFTTQLFTGGGYNPARSAKSLLTKSLPEAGRDIAQQFAMTGTQGLVGGSTSEALKSIGVDNPIAQFVATGGTTAAAGTPFAMRSTPADIVNKGLRNVTPEQLRLADALMKDSARIGAPITGAEAIAQVTGNKSLLGTQRFVENAQASQPTMNQFMVNRPAGQRQAFEGSVQVLGLPPTSATPINLQKTGKQVVRGAEQGVTASVDPFYQQGFKQIGVVPDADIAALKSTPKIGTAIDDAINHVINDPYSGVKGLPANDPRALNAAKIYLDTQYKNFSKDISSSQDATKAANAWGASREIDSYLTAKSPSYAKGSRNYEVAQKTEIGPLKEGPVGQIAEGANAAETLMPQKPVSLYPADIKRTVDLLRRKDPEALPSFVRQQLEATFNEASQNLQGGPNQFGGPKFAAQIVGNQQQRENLKTLVTEASGKDAWRGFETFLNTMEAQGQRLPANSATTFNEMARQELSSGLASKVATPLQPSSLKKGLEEYQMGSNAKKLAELLVDPDSVNKLEELARTGPKSLKRQAIVNSLIGGYTAEKPEIKEEKPNE